MRHHDIESKMFWINLEILSMIRLLLRSTERSL